MNSAAAEDEEWETADVNLGSLKLAEPVVVKSKPAFIMPARLLSRPIIGDINFLHDLPSSASESSSSQGQGSFGVQHTPAVVVDSNEQVDSALLNAIENPRERMQVLNLENVLLLFVKSSGSSMELPPEHNSFRRLLAYRIAHRFGLTHGVSDQLNENGERGIMIYRTGDTRIPNPLLIDLPPPSDYASDQSPFGSKQNLQDSNVGEATPPVVKKMTMMKRNPNRDNDVKKESSKKEKQTAEEKEKAYAEARARIFGAEAEAASSAATVSTVVPAAAHLKKSISDGKLEKAVRSTSPRAGSASPPPPLTTGQNATNSTAANGAKKKTQPPAPKKPVGVEASGSANTSSKSSDQPRTSSVSPAPLDSANDSGKGKKKTVDVTGWKEKKFTVRDQDAERSDPDFSRRNVSTSQSSGRGNSQHPQYVQPNQFRGPEDQMSGYQGQGQGVGMAPGGTGYQQNYQLPQDPYQYGQNGNVMMPYGPQGVHNIYVQGPFAMNHIAMGSTPGSPPHPQQQWQQPHPQGMMMNQHPGNPYYPHLPSGANMTAIHPPLGPGSIPMNIGMYGQIQGPIQGLGPVPGGYGTGPYGSLGGLYPPLPSSTNISNNSYNNLSAEQHQNPPPV